MSALVAFVLALGLALGLWPLLRPTLSTPIFERENFRHRRIPVAAGLVIVLAVLVGALPYSLVVLWSDDGPTIGRSITSAALAAVGFGLFGLLDDLAGSTARRGYRGHVGALRQGELTTGLLKLVGGGLVAVVVAWPWAEGSLPDLVAAALVVALAANLGNLLDRAPGRVGKVSLVAIVRAGGDLAPRARADRTGAGGRRRRRDAVAGPAGALHARRHRLERPRRGCGPRPGRARPARGRGGSPSSSSPRSTWPARRSASAT